MKKIAPLIVLVLVSLTGFSQSKQDREKARELGYEGIRLSDEGKYEEAIDLFEKARRIDPEEPDYTYEIAYAYYGLKQYKNAVKALETIIDHKNATDQYYQLLGNSYDNMKQPEEALKVYKKGLERFPSSGKLYLESGIVEYFRKNYNEAIGYWEKGVQVEPKFSSNYYWLGKVFANTDEKIWAVIYGELFMNLERGSKRTEEMSSILFDAYRSAINIKSSTEVGISFSKVMTIPSEGKEPKPPFQMHYELNMSTGLAMAVITDKKEVSIDLLSAMRNSFITSWYEKKTDKDYPNVLFDYQKKLADKGHLDAYSHWLLMKGNEDEFNQWLADKENTVKYDAFIEWYKQNPITLNDKNKFYRTQY